MRQYKAPGAYAHFIPSQNTVTTTAPLRVLALVGTGKQFFDKTNVYINRSSDSISDTLPNENIVEIYSVSSKPITSRPNPSNKFYKNYSIGLEKDSIVWEPIAGVQYAPTVHTNVGSGDSSFLSTINTSINNIDLIVNESYKIEISYAAQENVGVYTVSKVSNSEIIGNYVASAVSHTDIIPGVALKITSTFVLDNTSTTPVSKTKIGDYVIVTTTAAKCHIDPIVTKIDNNSSNDSSFIVSNGGSNYNIIGEGNGASSQANWPEITNTFSINKSYSGVNFKLTFYKGGIITSVDSLFEKFNVNVVGKIDGIANKNISRLLYDSSSTSSIAANNYDITSTISSTSSLTANDNFSINYQYVLKNDVSTDQTDIIVHLDVIDTTIVSTVAKIAILDNGIFVRNNIIPHILDSCDKIFSDLIQSLVVSDSQNIVSGNYKIKINDLAGNKITIFDVTNNSKIGTFSTDVNALFAEAIPGVSFSLYSFKEIEGLIEMYGDGSINDNTGSTILISTTSGIVNSEVPEDESIYYVSYKYAKADDEYKPKIFYNYDDVVTAYGKYQVLASGAVINSLSLGAEIAFLNGASPIICVQSKNDTDLEMETAIDYLAQKDGIVDSISAVTPITVSKNVGDYLVKHVNLCSSSDYNMLRMGYLAADINELLSKSATVADFTLGSIQTAQAYNDERIVYVAPGKVSKTVVDPITGYSSSRTLSGSYLAVATSAIAMSNDPAEPLTNKTIKGFDTLLTQYSDPDMNNLATAGCLVIKQDGLVIKIRHGITTHGAIDTLADIQSNEITLIQIKDYVINQARTTLGDLYIGGKLKPTIIHDIEYTLNQLFNKDIADDIIIGIDGLSVKRDLSDPRQINIQFFIEAVYPLNYIDISFGFSTTIN